LRISETGAGIDLRIFANALRPYSRGKLDELAYLADFFLERFIAKFASGLRI